MISARDRATLRTELVGVRARLAEAKLELSKLAGTSLVAYHQALCIVRDQEGELDAIERQLTPR